MEKDQNINAEQIKKEEENSTEKAKVNENNKEQDKKEKIPSPEEKILELEDKLTRTLGEMENQRRRFEKEKDDAFEYGGFSFARESLNLIDNLERAKQSLENDETLKNTDILKKTLEHFEIIKKDLVSVFKKNNVEEIKSFNKKLDPNFHQAMLEIEDDKKEPGTIIQVIQKGFIMKDRLLRPALVGVSKKTSKENENKGKDEKSEENKENLNTK
jgi:molecular chaperone GrpE